ncbi:DNA-3-methyladenine glycosylase 2 family protein [Pseudoteredinibacter isoporae]|uniref:DNA-3-methyladenine glycosylase II n=1 Tax=Pseudoteredinibacter isoporae TaxID=570281 RepID=A0A7X0JVZ8_9GAMM|nr:AlkA N-terminal domain-containing protein [Pseudoteredinibacter isoporae]MBB6522416.1 AraC family transcriptional regulator of adaptative response / DNA-3-methyladenine glycosylase II [Pseudoteredinibacter isoporae]
MENAMTANFNNEQFHQARLSRDARFDGLFYVAVKTTGIYCRPICPAPAAKEKNVDYYEHAWQAQADGFRPCYRCRPDASPGSAAWRGTHSSVSRAMSLIDDGVLDEQAMPELAERLGMSDRYLRKLFQQHIGLSPQHYAQLKRCDFAKQLVQSSQLSITDIALASGFGSVRQFNEQFKKYAGQTPSSLRKQARNNKTENIIELPLYYRPPYNWKQFNRFLSKRYLNGLEWLDDNSYGRSFSWQGSEHISHGKFTVHHQPQKNGFLLKLEIDQLADLRAVIANIRRLLDLDANSLLIEQQLQKACPELTLCEGLRLPGTWDAYEAGIRAILGQQISVQAAKQHMENLLKHYGEHKNGQVYFPKAETLAAMDFDIFKMPGARKACLKNFARYYCQHAPWTLNAEEWLALKGIGPWTVNYATMRGQSQPDILLDGDLGVKKGLDQHGIHIDCDAAKPWRSYLTLQLWELLQ